MLQAVPLTEVHEVDAGFFLYNGVFSSIKFTTFPSKNTLTSKIWGYAYLEINQPVQTLRNDGRKENSMITTQNL